MTPRSRSCSTGLSNVVSETLYWNCSQTNGSSRVMLLLSNHRITFSRSFCKRETSFSQQIGLYTRVSSAKLLIIDLAMQRSISLINMRKRMGPNTVPWGTPLIIRARNDKWPLTMTPYILTERKLSIQLISVVCIPKSFSFSKKIL